MLPQHFAFHCNGLAFPFKLSAAEENKTAMQSITGECKGITTVTFEGFFGF